RELGTIAIIASAAGDQPGQARLAAADLATHASQATLHPEQHPGSATESITVPVARLDALVSEPVDLMKIDVEGHEMAVLDGAANLFRRFPPRYIVIELHGDNLARAGRTPEEVASHLESLGYTA